MSILLAVIPLIFLLILLVCVVVFPILALVDVARIPNFPAAKKTGWILALIFLGPIASVPYYSLYGTKRWQKVSSWLTVIATLGFLIFFLAGEAWISKNNRETVADVLSRPAITTMRNAEVRDSVRVLFEASNSDSLFDLRKELMRGALLNLLKAMSEDGKVDDDEAAQWVNFYNRRAILPPEELVMEIDSYLDSRY